MATSTFNAPYASGVAKTQKANFVGRLWGQFIEDRVAKARTIAADRISVYSDEQLLRYGWSEADIKRLRGITR